MITSGHGYYNVFERDLTPFVPHTHVLGRWKRAGQATMYGQWALYWIIERGWAAGERGTFKQAQARSRAGQHCLTQKDEYMGVHMERHVLEIR